VRATVSYTLSENVEDLTLTGSGALDGTGNGLDNVIVGNDGANILSGLAGDDTLRGNGGADTLIGGDNDDIMNGGDGNNDTASYATASAGVTVSLATTSFQNTVGAGFDKISNVENLTGSGFADTLTGDSGKNTITGGGDGDTLTGGDGVDTFVYESASDSTDAAADTILDLTNTDKIDLSAVDSLFHVVGSFTGAGHELVFSYNSVDDLTTLAGDIDGDTIADLTILMSGDHTDFDNFI
jgi:Ca2+-binding RTX toxin-like protein